MKRAVITIFLGFMAVSMAIIEPQPEPEPIEEKPSLCEGKVREWYMYGKLISREQKIEFPDGSSCWIKSTDKLCPTDKQWLAKADKIWEAKQDEAKIETYIIEWDSINKPKNCPFCNQILPEDFAP